LSIRTWRAAQARFACVSNPKSTEQIRTVLGPWRNGAQVVAALNVVRA